MSTTTIESVSITGKVKDQSLMSEPVIKTFQRQRLQFETCMPSMAVKDQYFGDHLKYLFP